MQVFDNASVNQNRKIVATAFNELIASDPTIKSSIKAYFEDVVEEYEDFVPYFFLRNHEIGGVKFYELLYDHAVSGSTKEFFEYEILQDDPYLGLALKVDIDNEDDENLYFEEWNTQEDLEIGFEKEDRSSVLFLTETENEYVEYHVVEDDDFSDLNGNLLTFCTLDGFAMITEDMLTVDGESAIASALAWMGVQDEGPCEEATNNLQSFLDDVANNGIVGSVFVWFAQLQDLYYLYIKYCTNEQAAADNGGDPNQVCERNFRNEREEITGFRIPELANRKLFRRWKRRNWYSRRTYNIEVKVAMIDNQDPNNPTLTTTEQNIFASWGDLRRGRTKNLLPFPQMFYNWRLDEFDDRCEYYFVAKHKSPGSQSTISSTLNSGDPANTSLTVSRTLTSSDRDAGKMLIYYCEPITGNNNRGEWYHPGLIEFRLREGL